MNIKEEYERYLLQKIHYEAGYFYAPYVPNFYLNKWNILGDGKQTYED